MLLIIVIAILFNSLNFSFLSILSVSSFVNSDFIKLRFCLDGYRVQMQVYVVQNSFAGTVSCQILKRRLEENQASEHACQSSFYLKEIDAREIERSTRIILS